MTMIDQGYRRIHQRTHVTGNGVLTWDAGNGARQCSATVRNLGDGGLQLLVSRPLSQGWTAYLTGEMFECVGKVRYCVPEQGGFLVGLEFSHDPYLRNTVKSAS